MDTHLPETGTATCSCSGHKVVVTADVDPKLLPEDRHIMVSFWARGSHGPYSPSWRSRIRHAWLWLRGRPEQADEVLLTQVETLVLKEAVDTAIGLTWPNYQKE